MSWLVCARLSASLPLRLVTSAATGDSKHRSPGGNAETGRDWKWRATLCRIAMWTAQPSKSGVALNPLEEEGVIQRSEVQSLEHITHQALREHVQRVGIVVYSKAALSET